MYLRNYFLSTKDFFYNVILIFPLLIAYEILGLTVNYNLPFEIRNGADVLLRQLFLSFGEFGHISLFGFLLIIPFLFFMNGKKNRLKDNIKISYLILIIIEGLLFGVLLNIIFINTPNLLILGKASLGIYEKLYLAIGAGIFEELIFRFFLIGLLSYLIIKIFKLDSILILILLIFISSFIFSGFHYIGSFGDIFNWKTFLLRFFAGCYLGILYVFRGFGVCVISHIIYDFIIIKGV